MKSEKLLVKPLLNHGLVDSLSECINMWRVLIGEPPLVPLEGLLTIESSDLLVRVQRNQDMTNVNLQTKEQYQRTERSPKKMKMTEMV